MEGTDESIAVQLLQSSFSTLSPSFPKQHHHKQLEIPNLNTSQNVSPESNIIMSGIPPSPLNLSISSSSLQIASSQPTPHQPINPNLGLGISHSISSSQPSFFSMNYLPPLNPLPSPTSGNILSNVSMDDQADCSQGSALAAPLKANSFRARERIPPHKAHRRSISDVPLGFSAMIQSSPQLMPISGQGVCYARDNLGEDQSVQPVKQELDSDMDHVNNAEVMGKKKPGREVTDDLLVIHMNLDNIDALHSFATEDRDMDTRASGTKTHGGDNSDNEVESNVKGNPNNMYRADLSFSTERSEGVERIGGGDVALTARHFRSMSMDSFLGNLNIADESTKLPSLLGTQISPYSPSNSMDGDSVKFSLEFGNGEFSGAELKKIVANEKLAEIALSDPKRVKRILANRQSAARSKERKMRYISELEHKVQILQSEATTLSAQLLLLQRESAGLSGQNNELKFRLQALEQQAQLKDALNEALTAEVHRLKLAGAELRGEVRSSDSMTEQTCMNIQMFSTQN